jgi:hypothetical protein
MLNDQIITDAKLLACDSEDVQEVRLTIVRESNGLISLSTHGQVILVSAEAIRSLLV